MSEKEPHAAAIRRVLVVGSGVMGRGIAASFAAAGFETTVLSRDPGRLSGLPPRIAATGEPPREAPHLVLESIPEVLELKQQLFARLEGLYGAGPILASNTSGLSLTEIARPLQNPERFLGMHFFQPPETMELVELIRIAATEDSVVERAAAALAACGKEVILLARPVVGALVNRLQHALLHEAYHLIDEGIVTPAEIDRVAKRLLGPRMCVTGLLEQKDLSGLDTHVLAQRAIVPNLCRRQEPHPCLEALYAAGDLGVKTGRGFYDWRGRDVAAHRRAAGELLARLLAVLAEPPGEPGPLPR